MQARITEGQFQLVMDSYEDRRLLELAAAEYGRKKAEMETLQKSYKVGPELFKRLNLGENSVYQAIHEKRLKATPTGKKGYRVTELACLIFLGDVKSDTVLVTEGRARI